MATVHATIGEFPSARRFETPPLIGAVVASSAWASDVPSLRRVVKRGQVIYRAGQPARNIYLVHAGMFITCVVAQDGSEQVTGFQLRGAALGLDSIDRDTYAGDAIALDVGEVLEIPRSYLFDHAELLMPHVAGLLAQEVRRQWRWSLVLRTLDAEQRVVLFLLDLADRLGELGFSPARLLLRMTRAELANHLALTRETVARVLSRLDSSGLITVNCRNVTIHHAKALRSMVPPFDRAA